MLQSLASVLNPLYISSWEPFLGPKRWLAILKLLSVFFLVTLPLDLMTLFGAYSGLQALNGQYFSYPWGILGIILFSNVVMREIMALIKWQRQPATFDSLLHTLHVQWIHNFVYMVLLFKNYDRNARAFKLNREEFLPESVLDYPWNTSVHHIEDFIHKAKFPRSQSLVRFIKERIHFPDTGSIDTSFLIFSALVPRKEDLSIDGLKAILLAYPRFYMEEIFKKISKEFLYGDEKISHFFSNYTEEDLKKIFLRRYDAYHFYMIVQMISDKSISYAPFPVLNSLKEIYDFVLVDKPRDTYHKNLIKVDLANVDNFNFKLLRTEREYRLWGNKLRNCIKDQCWDQRGTDIIGIFKNKEFYAAVSFVDGKMHQIKLAENKDMPLLEQKLVLDTLTQFLT